MLAPLKEALGAYSVYLASGSPRRRELLSAVLPVEFSVQTSGFAEDLPKSEYEASDYVKETAFRKGSEVFEKVIRGEPNALVISADTVVVLDGKILEKPTDAAHSTAMLQSLSGATHHVYTGVTLIKSSHTRVFVERTAVTFSELSAAAVASYVESGDGADKAGSYGIQSSSPSCAFVEGIQGCYYNVMGLPINRLARELDAFLRGQVEGDDRDDQPSTKRPKPNDSADSAT